MLIVIFFPILSSLLLSFYLMFSKTETSAKKTKIVLGAYFFLFSYVLFAISINFLSSFLIISKSVFSIIEIFFYPSMLLLPLTIYLYIIFLIKKETLTIHKLLPHFFIAIQSLLFNILPHIFNEFSVETIKKMDYYNFFSLKVIFIILTLYYVSNAIIIYKKHTTKIKNVYSYEIGINFKWILLFISGYLLFVLCFFILSPKEIVYVVYIPFLMVTYYIYMQRYNQSPVVLDDTKENDKKNFLSDDIKSNIASSLVNFVEENKSYLQKDLTIHDISKELKINSNYISYVLNNDLNTNFVSFINRYRIEESKKILLNKEYNNYTIEAISEMVGFNSKSSFNVAFKLYAGLTPSQFKKHQTE